ncbi:AAA-ATPase At2g18193-like [Rhododendron vialii]|uniref:AAA-ATPase At2g18193-like n=1 Tax=Rhododendron vialii TaxID=182163 RepID=UPI00265E82A9|nr:AAA-ATPase At2g18193-like [Rhododendron vialii]
MREMMFSGVGNMQSAASTLFSAYASFAASMMLIRSIANDLVPSPVRTYLQSVLRYFFTPVSNQITIVVDEDVCGGISGNQVYEAAEVYLGTKIGPNNERFKVGKAPKQKSLHISVEKGEEILDRFDNDIELKWRFMSIEPKKGHGNEKLFFELNFDKKYKDRVLDEYLPFVLAKSKEIKDSVNKVVKLYTRSGIDDGHGCYRRGGWGSINLDHPATFETLAMDPELKKTIIDDLGRFLKRKDFYKKVGKAWKRGYLLYGPPGTGKSSLIAAMANYLNFDVYDLELTSLNSNSELTRILVSTTNRSILVIEDVDCSVEMQDRKAGTTGRPYDPNTKLTLSGLLNFIDGLWSSCGDERIIIFTTNYRDRLDPALLRPGRMDMHIHMSYCTSQGFKILASNYLGIHHHHALFGEIEGLIENVEVTPAEVAEELMKSEDADIALAGVVNFLKRKKMEANEIHEEDKTNGTKKLQVP